MYRTFQKRSDNESRNAQRHASAHGISSNRMDGFKEEDVEFVLNACKLMTDAASQQIGMSVTVYVESQR